MRDDRDGTIVLEAPQRRVTADGLVFGATGGANIIQFPSRAGRDVQRSSQASGERAIAAVLDLLATTLDARSAAHPPTVLAALGALAGFAAQQKLMLEGGTVWAQPSRAEHLDRLLLSELPRDASLWRTLQTAAQALGAQHLPNPNTLLDATLRCVGTTQFGLITLPLEYRLLQQPQVALAAVWIPVRHALAPPPASAAHLPSVLADACASRIRSDARAVPPHVALRIVMQAALAMALIEPRAIPGAATKPLSS